MIDENFKRDWIKAYKKVRRQLRKELKSCGGSESTLISNCAKRSQVLSDTLKELASTRINDGNLVPLIMAQMLAGNLAHVCMDIFAQSLLADKRPTMAMESIANLLYNEISIPLCMGLWESLQKDLIDNALNEDIPMPNPNQ